MALINRRNNGVVGDLLVVVGGVGVELVVVNTDPGVGIAGVDGNLDGGGDDVRGGDVEGEGPRFFPCFSRDNIHTSDSKETLLLSVFSLHISA